MNTQAILLPILHSPAECSKYGYNRNIQPRLDKDIYTYIETEYNTIQQNIIQPLKIRKSCQAQQH